MLSISHCSAAPVAPPRLLLSAPRIAGLLCAPKPVAPPVMDSFRLSDPRLSRLSADEFARLHSAFGALFTDAIDFMLGESYGAELRAAEAVFHEAITGERPQVRARAGLKARLDAFWEESQARVAAGEAQIKAEADALRRAYHIKPDVTDASPHSSLRSRGGPACPPGEGPGVRLVGGER